MKKKSWPRVLSIFLCSLVGLSPVKAIALEPGELATSSTSEIRSQITPGPAKSYLVSWIGDEPGQKCSAGKCALWSQVWVGKEAVAAAVKIASVAGQAILWDVEYHPSRNNWVIAYVSTESEIESRTISPAGALGAAKTLAIGSFFMPKTQAVVESKLVDVRGLDLSWNNALEKFLLSVDSTVSNGMPIRNAYNSPELNSFGFHKVLELDLTDFEGSELVLRSGEYSEGVGGFPSQNGWRIHWRTPGLSSIKLLTASVDRRATASAPKEILGPVNADFAFVGNGSETIRKSATGYELVLFARTIKDGVPDLSSEFHRVRLDGDLLAVSGPEKIGIPFADYESQVMQRSYSPFVRRLAMAPTQTGQLAFLGEYVDYKDGVDRVVSSSRIAAWTYTTRQGANRFQVGAELEASAPQLISIDSLLVGTYSAPTAAGSELRIAFFDSQADLNVPTFDPVATSALPGETAVISGENLDDVQTITNQEQDRQWDYEIISRTPNALTVRVPETAAPGVDGELTAGTPIGDFEVPGSITVLEIETEPEVPVSGPTFGENNPQPPAQWQQGPLAFWVKKFDDNEVKFYAKNILYRGKVQLFLNGREVDWIDATSATNPKLRQVNGMYYRVTGEQLRLGKNTFKAKLNGEWVTFQNGKQYTTYYFKT